MVITESIGELLGVGARRRSLLVSDTLLHGYFETLLFISLPGRAAPM